MGQKGLDAFFNIINTPATSLNVIQVAFIPRTYDMMGGSGPVYTIGKKEYNGFVDQTGAHYGKPYYYHPDELAKALYWYGSSGIIDVQDFPTKQKKYESVIFETIVIAVNFNNSGLDKILGSFLWGYNNYGQSPITNTINLNSTPTSNAIEAIKIAYPYYNIK